MSELPAFQEDALTLAVQMIQRARRQMRAARDEEPRCVWMSQRLWREIGESPYLEQRGWWRKRCAYGPIIQPGNELAGLPVHLSDHPRREPSFDASRDLVLPDELVGTPARAPRIDA